LAEALKIVTEGQKKHEQINQKGKMLQNNRKIDVKGQFRLKISSWRLKRKNMLFHQFYIRFGVFLHKKHV
jgi:wyosine [tRNA(Phe)-imidazoG37] synthetase (radical SAM superfamily)